MNLLQPIWSPEQVRQADAYTISHEPISSVDLMERAASRCAEWIVERFDKQVVFYVFCGLGNNGGDGLAIARMLKQKGYSVRTYVVEYTDKASDDFMLNRQRLNRILGEDLGQVSASAELPEIKPGGVIVDALFGIGLSRPLDGLARDCVNHVNASAAKVIAIDMPSGLFADSHTGSDAAVVNAHYTLSFQCPKLAFMFPENAGRLGEWHMLDIGLSGQFNESDINPVSCLTKGFVSGLLKPRSKFSHKGDYGHALLVAGKYGSMGAAILAARACLRSGAGLLTVHVPAKGVSILQIAAPEAMVIPDRHPDIFTEPYNTSAFSAIGIGPGIGTNMMTKKALYEVLQQRNRPVVLDADALNIISLNKAYNQHLPPGSILTPHPREFERLTRKAENDFDRYKLQLEFSRRHKVYLLLKGAYSCVTTPEGHAYFNTTGNPGMAKGGSGDVLTGLITGLLAQSYSPLNAVLIGMFIHGRAGDIAAGKYGTVGMNAGDIIECLPAAFMDL